MMEIYAATRLFRIYEQKNDEWTGSELKTDKAHFIVLKFSFI